jgi:membrane protease YdiL (CAAX protease family)
MTIKPVFVAPDGRLRATWRALVFVPAYIVLLLGGVVAMSVVAGGWMAVAGLEEQLFLAAMLSLASAAVSSLLLVPWLDHRSLRTLGLWFYEGWKWELTLGLVGGVALLSLIVALMVLLGDVELSSTEVEFTVLLSGLAWNLALLLPAAVHEELVFRGYPFQRIAEGWGPVGAVVVLSGLFGLLHLQNPDPTALSTANTMLAGVLLAVAYLRTRGLWLPIGLHFAWNFWMGPVLGFPISGIELSSRLLETRAGEPTWLTGGSYGPEGSIITTVVVVAATFWLARTEHLSVSPAMQKELE